ncbi:uncharacterized protein BDW43DRAFT_297047 [Aspergillus alliaceus]|uniref:uncharacterized protein n=1 Tax=Petromyces alliaceus TaxID=209559 RepID=UPI0012A6626A|nr:uncharacterized protein BDW43DRAFT_297047 [Aspergillus alliaceus]KAB8238104.1 hypothetical protein BDW43DRAFT_297047 [Aspergillus alliaceus]
MIEAIKAGCSAASATAYEYTKIIDIFVGQAQIMWPWVYGAFKVLLVARVNHTEMKQNVEEHMATSKAKFEIVDHLTTYLPSQRLLTAENAFKSFAKLWTALKPIVRSIERTFNEVRDIIHFSNHFTGDVVLTKVSRMLDLIEGEAVRFSKASDVEQTCQLFRRRVEAKLEKHDAHLADPFIDLITFEEARAQQLKVEEQRPEM